MTLFDHERLDVYKASITFVAWIGDLLDGPLVECRLSAVKHLDAASQSIANNIAEGNGKRSLADRCRFLDIAVGSASNARRASTVSWLDVASTPQKPSVARRFSRVSFRCSARWLSGS
jgi:four helix bundle protein